ncbi:MAG: 2,3-bisphosphoglycerate-independent phosphoglycerate mutase [Clostridium sp.]
MAKKPVLLMILDGFGITENLDGNAVRAAKKPNYDKLIAKYPKTQLNACGLAVGLPEGQMGNSEVGHLNIGAGRVIYQSLTKITKDIEEGVFFKNKAILNGIDEAIKNNSDIHLMGLLSDGGVHSHIDHLKALLKLSKDKGAKKVYIHAFLDGRDVSPKSAMEYLEDISDYINDIGIGEVATISGRYYAMDRDNRWERIQLAYNALVLGRGEEAKNYKEAIEKSYYDNKVDEFVLPVIITENGKPKSIIKSKDTVIFFNFRPDRAREMTRALNDKDFNGFEREALDLNFVTMTQYDKTIENIQVAYEPESYKSTLGEYVSKKGLKQLRIAETEKYAHVTFFFNGGIEVANEGEDRVLVNSPKVATYDLQPEMSVYEVTDKLIDSLDKNIYDMIILNYANPDMVGHTGVIDAAIKAIQCVDECLGRVVDKVLLKEGTVFITADHGNSEQMIDYSTGKPMTSHTTNKVPFLWISDNAGELREEGKLADIAPTMLQVLKLDKPCEMTGESLIKQDTNY